MIVKIEIEMDNAAFDPDPGIEVANILLELVKNLRSCRVMLDAPGETCKLRDCNGNTVGFVRVEDGSLGYRDPAALLRRLHEWGQHMGSWDSPVWRELDAYLGVEKEPEEDEE